MLPGVGNPKTVSAYALGRGLKVLKKKQLLTNKFKSLLDI